MSLYSGWNDETTALVCPVTTEIASGVGAKSSALMGVGGGGLEELARCILGKAQVPLQANSKRNAPSHLLPSSTGASMKKKTYVVANSSVALAISVSMGFRCCLDALTSIIEFGSCGRSHRREGVEPRCCPPLTMHNQTVLFSRFMSKRPILPNHYHQLLRHTHTVAPSLTRKVALISAAL